MHMVSAILRRQLLQHTCVAIGGIGTLRMVRSGVRLLPGRRLEPPRRVPQLAPTEQGDTYLQEIVAAEMGVDIATATEICRQWNFWTLSGGGQQGGNVMVLEGVGRIRLSTLEFIAEPEFLNQLNPLPSEPLVAAPAAARGKKRKRQAVGQGRTYARGATQATNTNAKTTRAIKVTKATQVAAATKAAAAKAAPYTRTSRAHVRARGRNPHQYTVSFLAVLILLGALGYLAYFLWRHTSLWADFQHFFGQF